MRVRQRRRRVAIASACLVACAYLAIRDTTTDHSERGTALHSDAPIRGRAPRAGGVLPTATATLSAKHAPALLSPPTVASMRPGAVDGVVTTAQAAATTVADLISRYDLFSPSPRRWVVMSATSFFGSQHPWARGDVTCPGGCELHWGSRGREMLTADIRCARCAEKCGTGIRICLCTRSAPHGGCGTPPTAHTSPSLRRRYRSIIHDHSRTSHMRPTHDKQLVGQRVRRHPKRPSLTARSPAAASLRPPRTSHPRPGQDCGRRRHSTSRSVPTSISGGTRPS